MGRGQLSAQSPEQKEWRHEANPDRGGCGIEPGSARPIDEDLLFEKRRHCLGDSGSDEE
jgi:hypothetical protein